MKKVALAIPNYVIRNKFGDPSDPPVGIASIASVLEEEGYVVTIIDANAESLAFDHIISKLQKIKPDLIGISCNYSTLHNPTLKIATMAKDVLGIPIVVGGNHATALAEYMIRKGNGSIDFVARGEGENILPELLRALQGEIGLRDVRGITAFNSGDLYHTEDMPLIRDLDSLPTPAYHLLPMNEYARYNIVSIRGCPYSCRYCASNVIASRKVRYRSAKLVVDEIEYLLENYGKKHFWFSDDTFTANLEHSNMLMDELIKRNLSITWSCLTRVNVTSKELLTKMKEAGCTYISYGVESGDEGMLRRMDKKITLDEARNMLQLTKEAGIRMYTFFLVGYPGETWETIENSYKLIRETRPDGASFAIVIPLPGTRLCDELLQKGIINYDMIEWDYLFAKLPGGRYENYAAHLASLWCNLSEDELIQACIEGENLLKEETTQWKNS